MLVYGVWSNHIVATISGGGSSSCSSTTCIDDEESKTMCERPEVEDRAENQKPKPTLFQNPSFLTATIYETIHVRGKGA